MFRVCVTPHAWPGQTACSARKRPATVAKSVVRSEKAGSWQGPISMPACVSGNPGASCLAPRVLAGTACLYRRPLLACNSARLSTIAHARLCCSLRLPHECCSLPQPSGARLRAKTFPLQVAQPGGATVCAVVLDGQSSSLQAGTTPYHLLIYGMSCRRRGYDGIKASTACISRRSAVSCTVVGLCRPRGASN